MNPNPDPTSAASTKSIEQQRLLELIEYVQHAARMRLKVVSNVREHADFILFEHQAALYDNVALNQSGVDDEDELWLSVVRPHGPAPVPTVEDPWLAPWLLAGRTVTEEPHLASHQREHSVCPPRW